MGRPGWRNAWWRRGVGSLLRSIAFLPLGFVLLQLVGCALGSASSPALKKDTRSLQTRPKAAVERKAKGPEKQSLSERSLLPPLPAKPPPMGGSGG
jgi:hypothetical protein